MPLTVFFSDYMSAFAIYWGNPLLYDSSTDRLTFSSTRINIGNHYNTTTGQFTCQYAGIYVFMLNLYKDNGAGRVWCHIRINGYNLVLANVPAESGYGWYESSGSTVLYLDPGDKVDVGSCRGANEIDIRTSFIGFLLQAV